MIRLACFFRRDSSLRLDPDSERPHAPEKNKDMAKRMIEPLERLPKESAREYALRFLKHNIVQTRLKPGAAVNVNDMAAIMGISRTPIREAMQELEKMGMLEIFPQSGSRVSYISYDKVHGSRFIRLHLETAVLTVACERFRPEDSLPFEEVLHAQDFCLQQHNHNRLMDLDNLFHRQIYILADNLMAYQAMESHRCHFDRVRRLILAAHDDIQIVNDHHTIYKALREGDKRGAREALVLHLSRYLEDEKTIRAKYAHYFND